MNAEVYDAVTSHRGGEGPSHHRRRRCTDTGSAGAPATSIHFHPLPSTWAEVCSWGRSMKLARGRSQCQTWASPSADEGRSRRRCGGRTQRAAAQSPPTSRLLGADSPCLRATRSARAVGWVRSAKGFARCLRAGSTHRAVPMHAVRCGAVESQLRASRSGSLAVDCCTDAARTLLSRSDFVGFKSRLRTFRSSASATSNALSCSAAGRQYLRE
jgi:hypothetical protein